MKIFGSISEIISTIFRKDSQNITLRPNQTTTYTAARDIQLPPGDAAHVILSATSSQTVTNKIIDGGSNTLNNIGVSSLATVALDADEALVRDGTGAVVSAKIANINVATGAAIAATKLADGSVDNTEFQRLGTAGTNAAGELVTTDGTQTLTSKTLTSPAITTPTGIVKADVGLGNVDNTSDATKNSATATLTNKTIDGDDNTVQDLDITSLKTVLGDADKVLRRDAAGVPQSGNTIPNTSALVTTDAAQVITAKDIDGGTASNTSRITLPQASTATLAALTRKEGTVAYDTTLNTLVVDDGSAFVAPGGSGSNDPTTMSDIVASRLGYKEYLNGNVYNGGALFTVTASSGTVALGRAVPYQNQSGDWNIRFTVRVTGASAGCYITMGDVDTAFEQALACSTDGLAPDYANGFGFCDTVNNRFYAYTAAGTGTVYISGDVTLNSKPNWVYA